MRDQKMKKLLLAAALGFFAGTTHADYRFSLGVDRSEEEAYWDQGSVSSETTTVHGTAYSSPVIVGANTPILEAPFVSRSSSVVAGYRRSTDTVTNEVGFSSRDKYDSYLKFVGGRAVFDRLILGAMVEKHESAGLYMAQVGAYLSDSTALVATLGTIDPEAGAGSEAVWGLEYQNLIRLQAINSVAISASYSGVDDYRTAALAGTFYLTAKAGVKLGYARASDIADEETHSRFSVDGSYFFNENIGILLGVARQQDGGFVEDYNILNVGLRANL